MNILGVSPSAPWRVFQVFGSALTLEQGLASTAVTSNHCDPAYFSGDSTAILGTGELPHSSVSADTRAVWHVSLEPYWIQHFSRGFLVFGCLRYFGGVHSRQYGACVEVFLNDRHIYRRDAETRRIIFGMIDRLLQSYPPLAGVRGWKILSSEPCRKSQFVNLFSIDKFGLKVMPPDHSDYFHRIEIPKLPDVWPLAACRTIYAWGQY